MKKTFIIAEAGVNHNGGMELAKELIAVAAESGADAVKFQSFNADSLVTKSAPKANYQLAVTDGQESQFAMLKKLELSEENTYILSKYAQHKSILFLSSPFDIDSLNFLITHLNLPIIKIGSGEITNGPLLLTAAQSNKNVILSTGMATLGEIEFALNILSYGYNNNIGNPKSHHAWENLASHHEHEKLQEKVTLLHCTTEYPAPFEEINLRAISTLRRVFQLPVGYSDHTVGIEIAIAAVALGAEVIEKHFTIDKKLPGPDHQASLDPGELVTMVKSIRNVELSIGHGKKIPSTSEFNNRLIARKSLVALREIKVGEVFTEENLGLKRPGNGISGIHYWGWLGKIATCHYLENEMIKDL